MMTLTDQNIRHLKPKFHKDSEWKGMFISYDQGLVSGIKGLEGLKYLQSKKWGYIPMDKMNIDRNSPLDNRNMRKRKDEFIYNIYAIWRIYNRYLQAEQTENLI